MGGKVSYWKLQVQGGCKLRSDLTCLASVPRSLYHFVSSSLHPLRALHLRLVYAASCSPHPASRPLLNLTSTTLLS